MHMHNLQYAGHFDGKYSSAPPSRSVIKQKRSLSLHWEKQLLACIHRPALFGNGNKYLIGKINEAAIVGAGGRLSKAHVDEVCLVVQDCDESPCQACAGLHSTQSRVPNLAGDQLSSCTSAATCHSAVALELWSLPPRRCPPSGKYEQQMGIVYFEIQLHQWCTGCMSAVQVATSVHWVAVSS